jgi:CheY-like chemotaxis protein
MIATIPTVLYVDDNTKSRRLLGSLLRDCGFEVITTADPAEAIGKFRELRFDAALIDYQMPVISGPELAQKMKTIHPNVPVVMLSGCAALPDRELLWVDAHFGSGTSLDDLLLTLRTLTWSRAVKYDKTTAAHWAHST